MDDVDNFKKEFGLRLQKERESRGLSQKSLARIAGVSRNYIMHIETGRSSPSLIKLLPIVSSLDISIDVLVAGLCLKCTKKAGDYPLLYANWKLLVWQASVGDQVAKKHRESMKLLFLWLLPVLADQYLGRWLYSEKVTIICLEAPAEVFISGRPHDIQIRSAFANLNRSLQGQLLGRVQFEHRLSGTRSQYRLVEVSR